MDRAGGVNLVSYWLRSSPPWFRLNRTRGKVLRRFPAAARGLVLRLVSYSAGAGREMILVQFLLRERMVGFCWLDGTIAPLRRKRADDSS